MIERAVIEADAPPGNQLVAAATAAKSYRRPEYAAVVDDARKLLNI
jgi:hypothetical protein